MTLKGLTLVSASSKAAQLQLQLQLALLSWRHLSTLTL